MLGDRIDVPALAGGLRANRSTLPHFHDVGREHRTRAHICTNHVDHAFQYHCIQVLASLQQFGQLLEELPDDLCFLA